MTFEVNSHLISKINEWNKNKMTKTFICILGFNFLNFNEKSKYSTNCSLIKLMFKTGINQMKYQKS